MAARNKNHAIDKLSDMAAVILEHIIKLQMYPNHSSARHWQAELDAWAGKLVRYHRGKSGNVNFKPKDFMQCIYEERIDDSPVLSIMAIYGPVQDQPDLEKLKKLVEEFGNKVIKTEADSYN